MFAREPIVCIFEKPFFEQGKADAVLKSVFYPAEDVRLVSAGRSIFSGALLIADISGFTEMTETLSRGGPEGIEELTSVLNRVFKLMTESVSLNSGAVLSFSGDSVLARFSCASQATACATAMMEGINGFRRVVLLGRRFSLRAKVVTGSGEWNQLIAGDRKGAHLITAGKLTTQLGARESLADGGDIITFVGNGSAATCRIPCPDTEPDSFASKGCERTHGEHRAVTPLFADMVLDMGEPESLLRLQSMYLLFRDTAESHGGFLHHVDTVSGGFVRFFMLFGAPVSRGNDVLNGVTAAMALKASMKNDSSVPVRMGIDTGYVFAGTVGGDTRRQYTVIGDPVNTAARLAEKSPFGEITASEAVMRRTRRAVRYSCPRELTVRGKHSHINCYAPMESIFSHPGNQTLLGRSSELSRLLDAISRGRNRLLIAGEPGIGKTCLLAMLNEKLERTGYRTVPTSAAGKAGYRGVFAGILRNLCCIGVDAPASEIEVKLDSLLERSGSEDLARRKTFLGRMLLDLKVQDPLFDALPPKLRMENLLDAVSLLILSIPGPVAITIEDMQQADPDELASLSAVVARVTEEDPNKVFILTARSEGSSRVAGSIPCMQFELDGLTEDESRTLLLEEADNYPLDDDIYQLVKKKASGNPFYLVQFFTFLRENGLIELNGRMWRKACGKSLDDLPESVFSMIMARIDTLSELTRQSLTSASVIGLRFTEPVLENLLERSVHRDVSETSRAGLTRSLSVAELEHIFSHMLIRDVAYDSILRERRQALHREVGRILEERHLHAPGDITPILAMHFRKGKHWEKALEYSIKAGLRADDEYRNSDAVYHCGRAIRIIEKHLPHKKEELLQCLHRSAMIHDRIGEYDRAAELFRNVAALSSDTETASNALLSIADILFNRGELEGSLELADEVERLAGQSSQPLPSIELRIASFRAWCHCVTGKVADAEKEALKAVAIGDMLEGLEEKDRAAKLGHALNTLATVHWVKSDYSAAGKLYRQAIDLARKNGMLREESVTWGNIGLVQEKQGKYREAILGIQKQLSLAGRIGEKLLIISANGNLSMVYATLGDFPGALNHALEQRRLAKSMGLLHDALLASNRLSIISTVLGKLDDAEEFLQEAVEMEKTNPMERERTHSLFARGSLCMARGRHREALECYDKALFLAEKINSAAFLQKLLVHKSELLAGLGRLKEAENLLKQADSISESAEMIHERASCRAAMGYLLGKKGMYGDALKEFQAAEEAFEAIEALPGLAETCLKAWSILSQAQGDCREQAGEYLGKARELYRRMDIPEPAIM